MTDIVKQLRWLGDHASYEPHMHHTAADEIERLREALRPFAERAAAYDPPNNDDDEPAWWHTNKPTIGDFRKARSALEGKE